MELKSLESIIVSKQFKSFNRTKWNWNVNCEEIELISESLLIVLNGIEIQEKEPEQQKPKDF